MRESGNVSRDATSIAMMGAVGLGFSPEVERTLVELFPGDASTRARAVLRPEQPERILLAVLVLSGGDLERLRHFSAAATADYRDVLYWAESPPEDEQHSRA